MQPPLGLGLGELDRARALQLAERVSRVVVGDFDDVQSRELGIRLVWEELHGSRDVESRTVAQLELDLHTELSLTRGLR